MKFTKSAIICLMATLILSGCATIFSGTKAKITVEDGSPSKAKVYKSGNLIGETPISFKIPKKSFGTETEIEIRAEGYKPLFIKVDKRVQAGFIVLDILTGLVELVVDFATGAIYSPDPKTLRYSLEKL